MELNTDFWGGADKSETLVSDIETNNYWTLTALQNGDIPLNEPLDISVSPWAINTKADFVQLKYGLSYRIGDSGYVWASPEYYNIHDFESDKQGIPFYFCFPQYTSNGGTSLNWQRRNGVGLTSADLAAPSAITTFAMSNKIVRKLSYNKLAYWARVRYAEYSYVPGMSENNFGNTNIANIGDYLNHADSWLEDHPIIQILLTPYYIGADPSYPNYLQPLDLWMNSLGYKQECPLLGTNYVEHGYTTAYIDDFMTIVGNGSKFIGEYGYGYGGDGWIRINRSDGYWVQSYNEDVDCQLSTEYNNNPMLKVPSYDDTKWVFRSKWEGGPVYIRTELNRSAFDSAADFADYIRTQIAYVGTWWFETTDAITETPGSSSKWYLGEIDSKGVTTGNYEQGTDTANLPNSGWTNPWEDSPYEGRGGDPNTYDDNTTVLNTNVSGKVAGAFVNKYATGLAKLYLLADYFYGKVNQLPDIIGSLNDLFVSNAQDCLVSIRQFPFDITNYAGVATSTNVIFGVYDSNIAAYWIRDSVVVIDAGKCTYYPVYGAEDFRSYPPYSHAELYIPYCGTVSIDPNIYLGHTISVKYLVDLNTGECLALVYRDGLVVDSLPGVMAVDIPISGVDRASYDASKRQAETQAKNAKTSSLLTGVAAVAGIGIGLATGNPLAIGAGAGALAKQATVDHNNIDQAEYNVDHVRVPYRMMGTSSSATSMANERKCRLVIYRPIMLGYDAPTYAHTEGHACLKTATLASFTGFTVVDKVDLSGISATAEEKAMITNLLTRGVYL